LDDRVKSFFLQYIEELSKQKDLNFIKEKLKNLDLWVPHAEDSKKKLDNEEFISHIENIGYTAAEKIILGMLDEINIGLDGNRDPKEIAEHLINKIRRRNQRKNIGKALEFIEKLSQIKGKPPEIFDDIKSIINYFKLDKGPLEELKLVTSNLNFFNIDWDKVTVNLGFGRGLEYYTGIIFEIYYDKLGKENQICGGGRYNSLVRTLGGKRDVPALGFAYGLERIKSSLNIEKKLEGEIKSTDIFIIPIGHNSLDYAIKISELLRNTGLKIELDVNERKVPRSLEYADKVNIPFSLLVGEEEKRSKTLKLRNMKTKNEQIIKLSELNKIDNFLKEKIKVDK